MGYCYDSLNRMTVAMENSTDVNCNTSKFATYSYDTLSRRTNLAYGNGASITSQPNGYSAAGDLLVLNHTFVGSSGPSYSFGYTAAHQLGTETISDGTYRWQPSASGTDSYATANSLNQYPQFTPSGLSPRPLTYDGKGNLATGNINGDAVWKFAYDPENRLTTACKPNPCSSPTVSATYAYDPLGRRIKKSGTGVTTTYFLSDGNDEIAEYDSTKTLTVRYIPGPAIDQPIAMLTVSSGAKEYFHTNHQGSVIAMTDSTGAKIEGPYTYDPYGNCFSGGSPCSSIFL